MKKFKKSEFKAEIKEKFGTVTNLKKHLKSIAKNEYGAFTSEITIYGCRVFYTSNPNHFCNFGISIGSVGMSQVLGLGKSSITKAGKNRGCHNHYMSL